MSNTKTCKHCGVSKGNNGSCKVSPDKQHDFSEMSNAGWEELWEELIGGDFQDESEHILIHCDYCKERILGFIKSVATSEYERGRAEREDEIIKLRSDLAHAIGFCQGLGHPEKYLEKQYPELLSESQPKEERKA